MKKIILIAGTFLCFNAMVAQTNTATPGTTNNGMNDMGSQTPQVITNHFGVDYPNTTATWYKDGVDYRAEYTDNNNNVGKSVTYNKDGVRIGTESQLSNGDYPATISDYYTKKYPNEDYQVWSSVDGAGNTTYYTNHKSETLWFDKSGKYTAKTKMKTYGKNKK